MKKIHAGEFKARCLAVMKKVHATGEPVLVTKRGKPIVKVVPAESQNNELFGFMAGEFEILGDIERPVVPLKQWEVLKK
jgi:prevent-host-death family protein